MKKNKILIIGTCVILTLFDAHSQVVKESSKDSIEIIRFCGFTSTYNCVFGIHIDKQKAIETVLNIMNEKQNSDTILAEMIIAKETMEKQKGLSIHNQFNRVSSKGYYIITQEDFVKLSTAEKKALLGNCLQPLNY